MGQDLNRREASAEQYPDEIDLVDVFRFFYKEKRTLLLGALLGGLIGYAAIKIMPVTYSAKMAVKVENQKSPNLSTLEALNTALLEATSSSEAISLALSEAARNLPDFARAMESQGLSVEDLSKKLAAAKPQDQMVKLEAGLSPASFMLTLALPFKIEGVDLSLVGSSLLNSFAKQINADALEDQTGTVKGQTGTLKGQGSHEPNEKSPAQTDTPYFRELVTYTEITGKLAALEARLLSQSSDLVLKHLESPGFASMANPQEAQFARIRFLLGLKAEAKKSGDGESKTLQREFVSLQEQALVTQQKIDAVVEASKKNGQVTVKSFFPNFVSAAKIPGEPSKLEAQSKKSSLGLIAGIFLGGMLSFMGLLATRFFKDNWQRITAEGSNGAS